MLSLKKNIVDALTDACNKLSSSISIPSSEIESLLEYPTQHQYGDLAFPAFVLSRRLHQSPEVVAEKILKRIIIDPEIAQVNTVKCYINFTYNSQTLAEKILPQIKEKSDEYGQIETGRNQKIVIDFSCPNIGKPMHFGHIRSTVIGDCLSKILKYAGYSVYSINYLGDIGLHVAKIIAAYQLWGNDERLSSDPDKELLNLYVEYCKKENDGIASPVLQNGVVMTNKENEYTKKAKEILLKLENQSEDIVSIWNKIFEYSLYGFKRIYDILNVEFDEITGQSKFSIDGKKVVEEMLARKIAYYDDGAVKASLLGTGLDDLVILRSNKIPLYATQDLGALIDRYNTHKFAKAIYVTGSEQTLYFKQIFKIIEKLEHPWSKNCIHVPFGLIHTEEGKMSTREGRIIFLDEVLEKAVKIAGEIILEKNPNLEDKEKIAKIVGIGAIKYIVLKIEPIKDFVFSWKEALNFESNSAPYIQYAYTRASSIMEKSNKTDSMFKFSDLNTDESVYLIKLLSKFPVLVEKCSMSFKPNILCSYVNELAFAFTQFYQKNRVIGTNEEESRLFLLGCFRTTMKNALNLLGIDCPEHM